MRAVMERASIGKRVCSAGVFVVALCGGAAWAAPIVTGNVALIPAPADVRTGRVESDSTVQVFAERLGEKVERAFAVDISRPCTVPALVDTPRKNPKKPPAKKLKVLYSADTVASGRVVDSYFIHYDPVRDANVRHTVKGSVTFEQPIVGLIVKSDSLVATHGIVGAAGTKYPMGDSQGNELRDGTHITLTPDRRTVRFEFEAGPSSDNIRVITAVDARDAGKKPADGGAAAIDPLPAGSTWTGTRTNVLANDEKMCTMVVTQRDGNRAMLEFRQRGFVIRFAVSIHGTQFASDSFEQVSGKIVVRNATLAGQANGENLQLDYRWIQSGEHKKNNPVEGAVVMHRSGGPGSAS